jgi:hypothetical protein
MRELAKSVSFRILFNYECEVYKYSLMFWLLNNQSKNLRTMIKKLLFSLFILTSSCRGKECVPLLPFLVAKTQNTTSSILVNTPFEIRYSIINLGSTSTDFCGRIAANSSHAILIDSFRFEANSQWAEVQRDTISVPIIENNSSWEYKRIDTIRKVGQYRFLILKDVFNEVREEGE